VGRAFEYEEVNGHPAKAYVGNRIFCRTGLDDDEVGAASSAQMRQSLFLEVIDDVFDVIVFGEGLGHADRIDGQAAVGSLNSPVNVHRNGCASR